MPFPPRDRPRAEPEAGAQSHRPRPPGRLPTHTYRSHPTARRDRTPRRRRGLDADPARRCGPPTGGTGRGRPGSRTSDLLRLARALPAYSTSNLIAEVPISISSPGLSTSGPSIRLPLIREPLVDPRSFSTQDPPRGLTSACWRETLGS